MSYTHFDAVAGATAPLRIALIDRDSATGEAPLSLTDAVSVAAHAQILDGTETVTALSATVADGAAGTVHADASALGAGSYAVQVTITDTAGVDHIAPSNGDGARVTIHPRFGG